MHKLKLGNTVQWKFKVSWRLRAKTPTGINSYSSTDIDQKLF